MGDFVTFVGGTYHTVRVLFIRGPTDAWSTQVRENSHAHTAAITNIYTYKPEDPHPAQFPLLPLPEHDFSLSR